MIPICSEKFFCSLTVGEFPGISFQWRGRVCYALLQDGDELASRHCTISLIINLLQDAQQELSAVVLHLLAVSGTVSFLTWSMLMICRLTRYMLNVGSSTMHLRLGISCCKIAFCVMFCGELAKAGCKTTVDPN